MTQIEYITGLLNKLNKKSISIITDEGLKKTVKNIVNLDIVRKFNYRCQRIVLIRVKVKGTIKHKIIYLGLSSKEQFRYLLLDLLDNKLEFKKINIDNLYYELEKYIEGIKGVFQISDNLSSDSIFKIEKYVLFLEKINFKNSDNSIIDLTAKIYTNIFLNYKIYSIPKFIPDLLVKLYNKGQDNNFTDSTLNLNNSLDINILNSNQLLYNTFVNIDIQKVDCFYDFFTIKNKENMLYFIDTIIDKSLEKRDAHKLKSIYKVLCNIIVYLKSNISETYILKDRLSNLCEISIFLDDILEFMEKVNFIKVISNNNQQYVSISSRYYEELSISKFLKIFNNNITNSSILIDSLSINTTLNNKQLTFLENFNNNNNISILIGKPGTGKSFISSLSINNMNTDKIAVLGPTGMAVKNIKKNIKKRSVLENCKTIHSFIYSKPVDINVLVIDEFGMVSTKLFFRLINYIDKNLKNLQKIVFIGDVNQLGPIGYGTPLRQLILSNTINVTELKKIVRQDNKDIPRVCSFINKGYSKKMISKFKFKGVPFEDNLYLDNKLPYNLLDRYIDLRFDCISNTNNGCKIINNYIQNKVLNRGYHYENCTRIFIGDKIMILKNDYEKNVVNGDFGYISDIDFIKNAENSNAGILNVEISLMEKPKIIYTIEVNSIVYDSGILNIVKEDYANQTVFINNEIKYYVSNKVENCPFTIGYCTTVHKYQGSETDLGLIYIDSSGCFKQRRNLLYTAISRCKEKIVLISDFNDLKRIINNENAYDFSNLANLLNNNNLEDGIDNKKTDFINRLSEFDIIADQISLKNRLYITDLSLYSKFWKQYKIYSDRGYTFKKILARYKSDILARDLVNQIIDRGDKDKLNFREHKLFYNYIKSRIKSKP